MFESRAFIITPNGRNIKEYEYNAQDRIHYRSILKIPRDACIFRKNRALAPHERSAVPLGTDHCPVG